MSTEWMLDGTYIEGCNCEVACPCVFLSPPTTGECTVVAAWHIDKGRYGDVSLDGLNVALAAHSPGHMLEVPWKAALYLDDQADGAQQQALTQIFAGQAGGHPAVLGEHIGEVLGVRNVPIHYQINGSSRSVRIGDVAEVDIEAVEGQGGAEVTLHNLPLSISPGHPTVTAKSKKVSYRDHGLNWELSDLNGFFAPFTYQGP